MQHKVLFIYLTTTILALNCWQASTAPTGEFVMPDLKPGESQHQRGVAPIVNVDKQDGKSTVDVHVPIFFDMTNHKDPVSSSLDLSVLSGLVSVLVDKTKHADGRTTGPVTVSVFGIPIYTGGDGNTLLKSNVNNLDVAKPHVESKLNKSL